MLDCVIVGGGPAGLAAAVYLARNKLSFALVVKEFGGRPVWAADVENYLGFHLLSGMELVGQFRKHLEDYRDQFELAEGEAVETIEKIPSGFRTSTKGKQWDSRTLLVATGTVPRTLDVPGEKEYYGKGVTYCAICDGPLFREKTVHVIGGGNAAMDAALTLEKYAKRVSIVTVNAELSGDQTMLEKIRASEKCMIIPSTKTTKIVGATFVTGIGLAGQDGTERVEPTDGIFVEIGLMPVSGFINFVKKDDRGQIVIDRFNATDVEGVWAAGDVTDLPAKQIAVAVGEGAKAAVSIIKYLQSAPALARSFANDVP